MGVIGNGKVFGQVWANVLGQFNWRMYPDMAVNDHTLQPLTFSVTDNYSPSSETASMYADLTANCGGGSSSITRTLNMIQMSGNEGDGVKANPLDAVRGLVNRVSAGKCSREEAKTKLEILFKDCTPEDIDRIHAFLLDKAEQNFHRFVKVQLAEEGIFGLGADAFIASTKEEFEEVFSEEMTPEEKALFNKLYNKGIQKTHGAVPHLIAELTALNMREVPDVEMLRKSLLELSIEASEANFLGGDSLLAAADVLRDVTISRDRLHPEFVSVYSSISRHFHENTIERERKITESMMASGNLPTRTMESLQEALDLLKAIASG